MTRTRNRQIRYPALFRSGDSGQAQVEFVLTILFVLLLIFGIIELIMLVYTYTTLADAAKEGVRYAIVHGADLDSTASVGPGCSGSPCPPIDSVVKNWAQASLHDTSTMAVNVDYNPGGANGPIPCNKGLCAVRVTVTYPYQPFFGLGWPTVTVNAAAEGRVVY
jgi:hypothetical protein